MRYHAWRLISNLAQEENILHPQTWLTQGWQLRLTSSLALAMVFLGVSDSLWNSSASRLYAQIIPDETLGAERSVVTPLAPGVPLDLITGGATRGNNLFHSFEQFNVGEGQAVYFTNPPDTEIKNILSRVTGGSRSEILGLIGSNANLFIMNPNGIILGPNAQLDVNGSFVATTANAIGFGDRGFFSASVPDVPPLLTVNPSAFLFNQIAAQPINAIASRASLSVPEGHSLVLLGGNISPSLSATGGLLINGGILQAPEGRVELGAVAESGTVGLAVNGNNLQLSYPAGLRRADVSLTNKARVLALSSDIQLVGRRITLTDNSEIVANNLGTEPGGTLIVTASESVQVTQASRLLTQTQGTGAAGDLNIETRQLIVQDGAQVGTGTFGEGRGGRLTVLASDSVQLIGTSTDGQISSSLFAQTQGTGAAGDLDIETRQLIVRDGSQVGAGTFSQGRGGRLTVLASDSVQLIGTSTNGQLSSGLFTQTEGTGVAGDLKIETGRLIVQDGAQVSASTFGGGQGGTLTVNALEFVELNGTSTQGIPSGLFALTQEGFGTPGDLKIDTRRLIVRDGAQISASNLGSGQGKRGNFQVNASESVELSGIAANGQLRSGLFVGTAGTGAAGDLTLDTRQLIVRDGAVVSAGSLGEGRGGTLTVRATNSVQLLGTSADRRFASSLLTQASGTGAAGNLRIETGQLIVRDGAKVTVSSEGSGDAGDLFVTARSIELNNGAALSATTKSGNGGDITLQVQDLLLLRHNSNISTTAGTAQAGGNGGNMDIDAKFLIAIPSENSDIIANAFQGNGGNIQIAAQGIFGIQFREKQTPRSDITASSELGIDGVVDINTPDVDPSRGLAALPTEVVDASRLIASGCATPQKMAHSEFIVTGRGGLPASPSDFLSNDAVWSDLRSFSEQAENPSSAAVVTQPNHPPSRQLVEAQGWMLNNKGQVVLTAQSPTVTPHSSWEAATDCRKP